MILLLANQQVVTKLIRKHVEDPRQNPPKTQGRSSFSVEKNPFGLKGRLWRLTSMGHCRATQGEEPENRVSNQFAKVIDFEMFYYIDFLNLAQRDLLP